MNTVELNKYREAVEVPLPKDAVDVHSMMSLQEKAFLYGYVRDHYAGEGVIVDAGIFLGGSTCCFGAAVRDNPRSEHIRRQWPKPVISYDHTVISTGMVKFFARHGIEGPWHAGGSFAPLLEENIRPLADLVSLRLGEITDVTWSGEPIEVLFLDIIKSREINRFIPWTFYRSLIPERSLVIHQDYFYDGLPFVKVTQEFLNPYFTYIGEIRSMAVFQLDRKIPGHLLRKDPAGRLPIKEQLALLDQALERTVDADRKFMVELSKVRLVSEKRRSDEAAELLESVVAKYPAQAAANASPRLREALAGTLTAVGRAPPPSGKVDLGL
jgi:hypothetical protein